MNSKEQKIKSFNPNGLAGSRTNIYGLPFNEEESNVIIIPVPWEVTVSFQSGTARGPDAIMEASKQVDLFDADVSDAWKSGIYCRKPDKAIARLSKSMRKKAEKYLSEFGKGTISKGTKQYLQEINASGNFLKEWVKKEVIGIIASQKLPVLLGGDHSTPLGFMEALADSYESYGILQIDAHCDLRDSYEGFQYSHASIMFNALKISAVQKLVQVGIRDYCEEELMVINNSGGKVQTYFDQDMKRSMYGGESWKSICNKIVNNLPEKVYISFDIDGLDPKLCPHTGTPVPGGLEFEQAVFLLNAVVDSGKKIIGCDLNEVAPGEDEWDANVGARLLYKMCNLMGKSNTK